VFIAAHKDYSFPSDPVYQPIHVGRATAKAALPFPGDDSGESISARNDTYCELTGLYWIWKNSDHDAYGLVHYRRYFAGAEDHPATGADLEYLLDRCDVVVPKRRHYVVQTVRQQYAGAHHRNDLEVTREAVVAVDTVYAKAFDRVLSARSLSLYNMFLMRRALLDEYCDWLFQVLDIAGSRIPLNSYGPGQRRVLGYLGERLLNVWLAAHPNLSVLHQPVHETEKRSLLRAGSGMLGRMVGVGRVD